MAARWLEWFETRNESTCSLLNSHIWTNQFVVLIWMQYDGDTKEKAISSKRHFNVWRLKSHIRLQFKSNHILLYNKSNKMICNKPYKTTLRGKKPPHNFLKPNLQKWSRNKLTHKSYKYRKLSKKYI